MMQSFTTGWLRARLVVLPVLLCLALLGTLLPSHAVLAAGASTSGRVYNAINNAPLVGATVAVGSYTAITTDNGTYAISGIATGNYNATVSFSGFRTRTINALPLTEGQSLVQNIALTPSNIEVGTIRGWVVNAVGSGRIGGIRVSLNEDMVRHSDSGGWYQIDDVPVGYAYTVAARAYSGYLPRSVNGVYAGEYWNFALNPDGLERGSISGNVTNASTQAAVAGVFVRAGFGLATKTDANGNYTLDNLPPGSYYLQGHKTGFESATAQRNVAQGSALTQDLALSPSAAGWVWGYVTNILNGSHIEGAVVTVGGKTVVTQRQTDYLWYTGYYIIYGVAPGSHNIDASAPGYMTRSSNAVSVSYNTETRMDIALTPQGTPVMNLTGTVRNVITGSTVSQPTVWVAGNIVVLGSDNGSYTIPNLPIGANYDLRSRKDGYRERLINGIPLSGVSGSSLVQNIALTPSNVEVGSIRGWVVNAVGNARVGGIRVSLTEEMVKHSDSGGWYQIDDVPVGYAYTVTARAYSGYLPRSVNGVYAGEYWNFALNPEGLERGSISGNVSNAATQAAVAGVFVRAGFGLATKTDANGNYTLDNLPPATYYLQGHKTGFESATAQRNVAQGSALTQDLALSPSAAGWVWGYVTNILNGSQIEGAVVTVGGKTVVTQRQTDYLWYTGYYIIYGVAPGSHNIDASAPGYMTRSSNAVSVSYNTETRMDIALTPQGTPVMNLTGTVRNVITGSLVSQPKVWVAGNLVVLGSDNGSYTIPNLPTGASYDLRAGKSGYRDRLINDIPLSGTSGTSLVQNIALTPSNVEVGSIRGWVVNAVGNGRIGGIRVSLTEEMVKHSDSGGWYQIDDVPVGYAYTVTARAYSGYLPRSVNGVYAGEYWNFALNPEGLERGSISGNVTNAATQAGVGGAFVRAGFGLATKTDANGNYTLDNLPPATYYLQGHKTGFESATAQRNVAQGSALTHDLALTPSGAAGWVWGYVTNTSNGSQIEGAVVTVGGKTVVTQRQTDYVWYTGYYIIYGVAPGSYTGIASHPAYQTGQRAVTVSFQAETRADFGLAPRTAQAPLAEIHQPVASTQVSGVVSIIGTATDIDFKQYKVEHEAATQPGVWNPISTNQTTPVIQGRLAYWDTGPLAAGQYTLKLTVEDLAGNSATATVVVQVVKVGATINGAVRLQGVPSDHSGVRVALRTTGYLTFTGTNGSFALIGVPAGTYTIEATARGYLTAARQVTVAADATVALPEVNLVVGDWNGDGVIDVNDLALGGINFSRTASPW